MTITVGIRELRDHLSKRIADVVSGETIAVTQHGRVVAHIHPVGGTRLDRLIADGRASAAVRPKVATGERPSPLTTAQTVSELVGELRE